MNVKGIYTLAGAALLAFGLVTGTPPAPAPNAAQATAQASTPARG